jgi:hypothetical protein
VLMAVWSACRLLLLRRRCGRSSPLCSHQGLKWSFLCLATHLPMPRWKQACSRCDIDKAHCLHPRAGVAGGVTDFDTVL